jgi:tRNA(adenine34) deaminase
LYVSDLPTLAGLRMHYIDQGPKDSAEIFLCLHPVPGWGYGFGAEIEVWLGQGARVVVPDLIGFGRSDKPKREDFHSAEFHIRCVADLMERLHLHGVVVVSRSERHWLAEGLCSVVPGRIQRVTVVPTPAFDDHAMRVACDAPFPDAGHRAAERAFAALGLR